MREIPARYRQRPGAVPGPVNVDSNQPHNRANRPPEEGTAMNIQPKKNNPMSKRTTVAVAISALPLVWLPHGLGSSTAVADTTSRCPAGWQFAVSSPSPRPAMRQCQARSTRLATPTGSCARFRCPTLCALRRATTPVLSRRVINSATTTCTDAAVYERRRTRAERASPGG
jgi:hypothetical protein